MSSLDNIDIFDNPFRDPVYEELGFTFDPERNQYYEVIEDPEYGMIRRLMSGRIAGGVSDRDMARSRRFKKTKPLYKSGERVFGLPVEQFEVMQAVGERSDESERKRINQLIRDMGFDTNAKGGVGSLEMDLFSRSR